MNQGDTQEHIVKGNLELHNMASILLTVFLHRLSGKLEVSREKVVKRFFFVKGNLIFASSNQMQDRLGDILLQEEKITQSQYDESVEELKKGKKRQGAILIKLGYMTTHDLILGIRHQIKTILFSVVNWRRGSYIFVNEEDPVNESVTLRENTLYLLSAAQELLHDPQWLWNGIVECQSTLSIDAARQEKMLRVSLTPYERKILNVVNEKETKIEGICNWSEYNELETLKSVHYLLERDLLKINNAYWGIT